VQYALLFAVLQNNRRKHPRQKFFEAAGFTMEQLYCRIFQTKERKLQRKNLNILSSYCKTLSQCRKSMYCTSIKKKKKN
jgi:hypothetical protein